MTYLPNSTIPVLASGGADLFIHLFTFDASTSRFNKDLSLQGHADWVRSLSFCTYLPDSSNEATMSVTKAMEVEKGDVLLASGSQDKYVRIWKLTEYTESVASSLISSIGETSELTQDMLDALANAEM